MPQARQDPNLRGRLRKIAIYGWARGEDFGCEMMPAVRHAATNRRGGIFFKKIMLNIVNGHCIFRPIVMALASSQSIKPQYYTLTLRINQLKFFKMGLSAQEGPYKEEWR